MIWALVMILVLMIPILAIVLDSQVGQALANRISRGAAAEEPAELAGRLDQLEAELRYLSESVESLREETQFVRSLIEGPPDDRPRLESGD